MAAYFNNDLLIDAQGQVRRKYVRASARRRAQSQYGADCTDLDIAFWEHKLFSLAMQKQELWRRDQVLKHARAA